MSKVTVKAMVVMMMFAAAATAGEWQKVADLSLNLTQSSYSQSWTGSELGAMSWTWNGNVVLENQFSEKMNFKNDLKLQFGQGNDQQGDHSGSQTEGHPPPNASQSGQ